MAHQGTMQLNGLLGIVGSALLLTGKIIWHNIEQSKITIK
jgi:hypothetical protein